MEKIIFKVQGSAEDPYIVEFCRDGGLLGAHCTCPAGENGQACKHRIRILKGNAEGTVDCNQADVAIVGQWFSGSKIATALTAIENEEVVLEKTKKNLASLKKELGRLFETA
ncbi:MAG TPA: SWIM zinc finger family protein [Chthonomonadales bacterium]|nr:SWIM zinc finger family protein [Chthonomonadales bacterium]